MNKSMMLVASGMLALASCTEYSDYNSVPEDGNPLANKTLMENISENAQLQDFAAIVNNAGCADILNNARVFTLWAPLDGTYDATQYLNMDSAGVMDKFVKQHLAEYSYLIKGNLNTRATATDQTSSRVIVMNLKHHDFTNTTFGGVEIRDVNIPASNGIMHTLNGVVEYRPNLYEYLDIVEGCDSFADYIHQYDVYTIDKSKSVIGPMVNGKQTYKDTVWTKSNSVMRTILHADLANEDSTYTLLIPTNEAWKNAKSTMGASYNYITGFYYVDLKNVNEKISDQKAKDAATIGKSDEKIKIDPVFLKDTLMNAHILRNLVYSNTNERNSPLVTGIVTETDTLFSTSSRKVTSIDNFIKKTEGEIEEMSNGYVRRLSEVGYYPWESYEPIYRFTRPGRVYNSSKNISGHSVQVLKSKVTDDMWGEEFDGGQLDFLKRWLMPDDSSYLTYFGTDATEITGSARTEMDFYLKGAMATKYRIYVVFVPETLEDSETPVTVKETRWTFGLSAHKNDGTPTLGFYKNDGTFGNTSYSDNYVKIDKTVNDKIHAVYIDAEFPICYENTDAAPVLYVENVSSTRNASNYDRNLRIAGVFLVPYSALEHVKKLKYEKK